MERFLDVLSPALRGEVERVLEQDPDARVRLTAVASSYIDEEGNWPTEPSTAQVLAQRFLHQQSQVPSSQFRGAGLASATVAGLAGAGLALGGAKGAVVLSSSLMANYWQEVLAYQSGMHPLVIRALKRVFDRVSEDTPWEQLARDLTAPSGPTNLEIIFGDGLAKIMERELLGVVKTAAWRGSRSAIHHSLGQIGDAGSENPWVESYIARFAQQQREMSMRTIRLVIDSAINEGAGPRVLAGRLKQLWSLTPRHAQAVENYRSRLNSSGVKQGRIRQLTQAYADRLLNSRLRTLSTTESLTAFNLGREAQWLQAVQRGDMPLNTLKMWVTAQDELVCKICRPLDGDTAPLGSVFQGTVFLVPAAHPNCRCIIVPVHDVPDLSTSKRLIFPAQEVAKHLPGQHDQKTHGRRKTVNTRTLFDFVGESESSIAFTLNNTSQKFIDDVRKNGIRNPIIMGFDPNSGKSMLLDGSHRMKVALHLGIDRVPVVTQERRLSGDRLKDAPAWVRNARRISDEEFDRIINDEWSPRDIAKHLPGKHDQKEHGNWARRTILRQNKDFSPRRKKEIIEELTGNSKNQTRKNIIEFLMKRATETDVEVGIETSETTGGILNIKLGWESSTPNVKEHKRTRRHSFHSHPVPAPPSLNDVLKASLDSNILSSTVVTSDGVYTMTKTRDIRKEFGSNEEGWANYIETAWKLIEKSDNYSFQTIYPEVNERVKVIGREDIDSDPVITKLRHDSFMDHMVSAMDALGVEVDYTPHDVSKRLVFVETYTRDDGTTVTEHFRSLPGKARSGMWDVAARLLSRGEIDSFDTLVTEMRKENERASRPLRELRNGKITDFSVEKLGLMTEGVGFRFGNENHIKTFANDMIAGKDVFKFRGRRDPIMVLVYDDGAQVLDGKHRLAAARLIGRKEVPIQVARIRKPMPAAKSFRQEWDELRRQIVRYQFREEGLPPKREEPFNVRDPFRAERSFNEWMQVRSALRDEERFLELGVERGVKPRRFRKVGGPSL